MDECPILLVDEGGHGDCLQLRKHLLDYGYGILEARRYDEGLLSNEARLPALVIIFDSKAVSQDGLRTAERIRARDSFVPIILVTWQSSEAHAIAALKLGINDYFTWPIEVEKLVDGINRMVSCRKYTMEITDQPPLSENPEYKLVGESFAMSNLRAFLPKVGLSDSTVLITGETGTGKECVARQIHEHSTRHKKPLICLNCAAIPDSLLESELFGYERGAFTGANGSYCGKLKLADGGTVFLDEIGDMTPYAQAKILRLFDNNEIMPLGGKKNIPVDFRIIAATNKNLRQLVDDQAFRDDLYYRIKVTTIHIPPLRERKEDIPALIDHYLKQLSKRATTSRFELTDSAVQCLLGYDWPGNVRELKNMLEALLVQRAGQPVDLQNLPEFLRDGDEYGYSADSEKELLLATLTSTNWNKSATARKLQWSRMTVYRKMQKYQITPKCQGFETSVTH